jgi:uncharacterized protein YyaL (SSP411 family)
MRGLYGLALMTAVLLVPASVGGEEPKEKPKGPANRLAKESSPYLLQHAHNPVDWYPWGAEAFAKAKKEGKLVFLSIGYSSCHWCHVMEKESFENAEVAKILNDGFVCIKVDREERPDVDTIYMTALNALGQGGGWPLSMFLTADAKPIFGGTYWPPDDKVVDGEKIMGFKTVLATALEFHKEKPKDLIAQADKLATATADALARSLRGAALVEYDRALVTAAVDGLNESADPVYGGFGSKERKFKGTKFPTAPNLGLLLHEAGRGKSPEAGAMLARTLEHMARGGIFDHLGGGFHRYSTERTWTVPHFEKMLYDNAQLAEVYARAYHLTKKPLYRDAVRATLAFVDRELSAPDGGFYSALDADSEGEEGRFYVWTEKELAAALPEVGELAVAHKAYDADAGVNFEGKYHILVRNTNLADVAAELKLSEEQVAARLESARGKLFEARARRPRPLLDTKVLTAWNGEMIAGYATAGRLLEEPKYTARAARAADFVLKRLRDRDGRLLRTFGARPGEAPEGRLNAYLDDYAFLVDGLLCLHDATGEAKWLDQAKALTATAIEQFGDAEQGGFFFTSKNHEKLFARGKDQYDGAQPSGNSVAARNLVRLWLKTKDPQYRKQAEKSFQAFAGALQANPTGLTAMAEALAMYLDAVEAEKK